MSDTRIRLVIADDHAMVREGLRTMLAHHPSIEVVAEADTGAAAIAAVERHRPDVILLDIRLPDATGLEVCRKLNEQHPRVNVVMLTVYEDEHYVLEALRAGAKGYLLKKVTDDELTRVLKSVCAGEIVVDPSLASQMAVRSAQAAPAVRLTEREREVLTAMADGLSNAAIASQLVISEETVKTHVKSLLRKLGALDRTQAVSLALRSGLLR